MKAVVDAAKKDPAEFWVSVTAVLILFSAYWMLIMIGTIINN